MKRQLVIAFAASACLMGLVHAKEPVMCGTGPVAETRAAAPADSLRRSAEELVAKLDPARQSDLLLVLNEGTAERLVAIDGIAKVRAASIMEARPFQGLTDVIGVKGIGLSTFGLILSHDPASETVGKPEKTDVKKP